MRFGHQKELPKKIMYDKLNTCNYEKNLRRKEQMRKEIIKAIFVVFIASFCTMVIELVAGRIMAPYVGVSLYTWTSIIGVVLAGISIGAYAGGILADRFPTPRTLGWLLFLSGLGALSISPLTEVVAH